MRKIVSMIFGAWIALAVVAGEVQSVPYEESFADSLGDFVVLDINNSTGYSTWSHDASYGCAKVSGHHGDTDYELESWLISPAVAIPATGITTLSFDHAAKFGANYPTCLQVYVSTDYHRNVEGAEWSPLTIKSYPSGSNWTFVQSGDISLSNEYAGDTITFAYAYISSEEQGAATWEIKNIRVSGSGYESNGDDDWDILPPVKLPVALPNAGDGRLRVCGQNTLNYFVVNKDDNDKVTYILEQLEAKTDKMVNSFLFINADIYAMCELEVRDSTLSYLTNAMNRKAGREVFAYVEDGLTPDYNYYVKSGFIYRKDRVTPDGRNRQETTRTYYKNTMRAQAWKENATGEMFVLSMNHFKAKDSSSDEGEGSRMNNARDLVSFLNGTQPDPDLLVMGDLNCQVDESPLQYLITNARLEEQLLRFDSASYSYFYWGRQLIDHALANSTMAEQIKGAAVYHINTETGKGSNYWYSDHDPVIVTMNLGGEITPTPTTKYSLELFAGVGGYVNAEDANGRYKANSKINISATPYKGYQFVRWSDGNTDAERTYVMPAEDVELVATFAKTEGILQECLNEEVALKYIVNGQVVIVRGEKMYNLMGIEVE